MMIKSFKVLSALLSYPSEDIVASIADMRLVLSGEHLLSARQVARLTPLLEELATRDLYDLQERYVLLFDRTRSLSLHMFEHVHGESRDRGQAMVDLKGVYEEAGMMLAANELPDYLPLFLEFLSTQRPKEAIELLSQPAHIFAALAARLRNRESSYTPVFEILAQLGEIDPKALEVLQLLEVPDIDPNDLEALDAAWMDEEVRFGPSMEAQCGGDSLLSKLRAASRPAPGMGPSRRTGPSTTVTHSPSRHS